MYPRAGAYIISVKQSTYCQFGEVIRAHSETEERVSGEGRAAGWGKETGDRRTPEKIRGGKL